ncbi:MAG TPA: hypothetical protein PLK55_02895 [archaeon]|jgi:hypothetical protein|nr:hypothetical protein [archaeon]
MVIYSIFIFKFYRFIAKRDIVSISLEKYKDAKNSFFKKLFYNILYVIKYLFFTPIIIFFSFVVLTIILSFLAEGLTIETILLTAIALIGAIRITAYHDEDLSRDLAKMLPFTLLGIFLVNVSYFSMPTVIELLKDIPSKLSLLVYYFVFIVIIEFVARMIFSITIKIFPKKEKTE